MNFSPMEYTLLCLVLMMGSYYSGMQEGIKRTQKHFFRLALEVEAELEEEVKKDGEE